jgi:glycosyltransferase involved in cell wall biosynthesis
MRLLLDMQACQTASRTRGIGRYVGALARAMLEARHGRDTAVALDGTLLQRAAEVEAALRGLLPPAAFSRYHYPLPTTPHGDPGDPRRAIAAHLIARHHAGFHPDAVLLGSLFEGYAEPVVTCDHLADIPATVSAGVLYDLIPLLFPEHYLTAPGMRDWYYGKLQVLKNCDLLLALSAASKRDAIAHLGIPAGRIEVIFAAADPVFRVLDGGREAHIGVLRRLGIRGKYVLYTGNGDFRKNVAGALEAFARLPEPLRREYQLVLNQHAGADSLGDAMRRFGLGADEVVATGFVSDTDLVVLYNGCELFVFPSLYEGFGLPLLEAMACGAPALGADNSSIPELIPEQDARFDARDPAALAALMERTLGDTGFRLSLAERGLRRSREFSWRHSAQLALAAIEQAVATKRAQRRAAVAVGRRRRIALFTPLPPERTGIANYSAELLPELAKYFHIDIYTTAAHTDDIWLQRNFKIRPWQEFNAASADYEAVVYQVGNSPFHSHMFELMAEHPGILVLHDFFLSSVFLYETEHAGRKDLFGHELEYAHGPAARRLLESADGAQTCKRLYPCNRRVLDRSIGIIAHSPYVDTLIERFYAGGVAKQVRVVRQMRRQSIVPTDGERRAARERLGLRAGDWVICSFGFIADTKLNDHLIRAFAASALRRDRSVRLLFVGELHGGDYGRMILDLITTHGLSEQVGVTGFLDNEQYEDYLRVADIAVQLRTHSRGETSRAVLDCLAHGIPTVINAHATFNDYPADVVVRVSEAASAAELGVALEQLRDDPACARALGAAARDYIEREHAPGEVALGYASAIDEFMQRKAYLDASSLANDIVHSTGACAATPVLSAVLANSIRDSGSWNRTPRLLIDLSEVVHSDYGTGIHRVVRNLTRELVLSADSLGYRGQPAFLDGACYRVAADYARTALGLSGYRSSVEISFAPGDVLFMLDSAWSQPQHFVPLLQRALDSGSVVVGFVYDLIPLRYPQTCVPYMPETFRLWLEQTVRYADAIVCISRATADDLAAYVHERGLAHRPGLRIDYAHLGSDLDNAVHAEASSAIRTLFDGKGSVFLMVGTLEPRKDYPCALDAFEQLWQSGRDVALCIAGKAGWNVEALVERLRSHREFGKRLFWIERVDDADLDHAYRHAAGLIQASIAEGFGLPILEAAARGTPVICSDIAVFREVAGTGAHYFAVGASASLARTLEQLLDSRFEPCAPTSTTVIRNWNDCARDVLDAVRGARKPYISL